MNQKKRHHFVPKAYLNSFKDVSGRILVYRKDKVADPLSVAPDATQFRRYYYSQPKPGGGVDNNALEDLFSTLESGWPEVVEKLHPRDSVNDHLELIFQFIALQRVRVPAARDLAEAIYAATVRGTMNHLARAGKLPPPPAEYPDLLDRVTISIDPHQSIHAMAWMMKGMETHFDRIGLVAIHNATGLPFLTSDNPVVWYDGSMAFERQAPYTIKPGGPFILQFPVSPTLVLIGSPEHTKGFDAQGLLYGEAPDQGWVHYVNAQTCRFAYEAVIAQQPGQEALIEQFANVAPVHKSVMLPTATGEAVVMQQAFGPRPQKPKWQGGD